MFLLVSGVLISATIVVGAIFANRITRPIRKLVQATELVQAGDLTIQVPITPGKEDELVTLSNAFNKMIKKLDIQQKDLAIAHTAMAWSDVARRVAHEIKNPLTPITLSAERLAKKFKDQVSDPLEFQKYIAIILRHINDIEKIVTEFIDFSKMPSPKFELENIVSIIRDLVESKSIINDNIKYEFGADKDDIEFMCDKTQIHQLIINLLKNAEEALEMDSIVDKRITTSINISDEELVIMIRDNGKGFALNFLNKATDAYTSNNSKGMGLGLSIVKKIAYDHGGDVIISNAEGGGAEVKLVFNAKTIGLKVKK